MFCRENLQIRALQKLEGILLHSPKVNQPLLPWMGEHLKCFHKVGRVCYALDGVKTVTNQSWEVQGDSWSRMTDLGALLPHSGRPLGLGQSGLLTHGFLPIPRHELVRALPHCFHHRALHCHLSPHESSGSKKV